MMRLARRAPIAADVTLGAWLTDMLAGKAIPNVDCTGQGC